MSNEFKLLKINSKYILREIFSFIDCKSFLKIIKYNKLLQNKLKIDFNIYKTKSEFPKYIYQENVDTYYKRRKTENEEDVGINEINLLSLFLRIFYVSFVKIKTLISINAVPQKYKSFFNVIIKIENKSIHIIILDILYFLLIYNNYRFEKNYYKYANTFIPIPNFSIYNFKTNFVSIILIVISIFKFIFLGFILFKSIFCCLIFTRPKTFGVDLFVIICHFIESCNVCKMVYLFLIQNYSFLGEPQFLVKNYDLISFNGMDTHKIPLPKNFKDMTQKKRKIFLLNNITSFTYTFSKEIYYPQFLVIQKINNFRDENNIPRLSFRKKISKFIIKDLSEQILFPEKNYFKFLDEEHIFKYTLGKFGKKFKKKDFNILKILLNKNFKYIQFFKFNNYEYYIFSKDDQKISLYHAENSEEYFPDKIMYQYYKIESNKKIFRCE